MLGRIAVQHDRAGLWFFFSASGYQVWGRTLNIHSRANMLNTFFIFS